MIEARIQSGGKASQGIGFSHAGMCGKHTDSSDVLQIIQPVGHLLKISGDKVILFLQLLFVERIEGKSIERVIHQLAPPALA